MLRIGPTPGGSCVPARSRPGGRTTKPGEIPRPVAPRLWATRKPDKPCASPDRPEQRAATGFLYNVDLSSESGPMLQKPVRTGLVQVMGRLAIARARQAPIDRHDLRPRRSP